MTKDDGFNEWLAAFEHTDLGSAMVHLRAAIFRFQKELTKREMPADTEDARRRIALNFIMVDVLEDRPIAEHSARELELLEALFCLWRSATATGPGQVVAEAMLAARYAGILVPTGEQKPTKCGSMADTWAFAGKRPLSS